MKEHLGLLDEQRDTRTGARSPYKETIDVTDPVSDSFFIDVWTKIAANNTRIYEKVFRCYPTDQVSSFEELHVWLIQLPMARFNPSMADDELRLLCGCLVEFPKEFLCSSRLAPGFTSKEGLVPTAIFT
jgi:phospholipase D1/2